MAGFLVKRRTLARGGMRAGSSNSNYTDINSGGYATMTGCARTWNQIPLPARSAWNGISSACTHALSGSVYIPMAGVGASGGWFEAATWSPSSTTCNMHLDATVFAPGDIAATGGSMALYFQNIVNTDIATANSSMGYRVNWNYINGAGTCSVKSGSAIVTACNSSASAKGTHWEFALGTCLPSFDKVGQLLLLHVQMLTGACTVGAGVDFLGARLSYLSDRLGASTP